MADEVPYRISEREREEAILALREHLLDGRLTLEAFTERVGLALGATVRPDLEQLHADLPALAPLPGPARRKRSRVTFGLLAHVVRRGRLRLGPRSTAVSVLSDIDLDLREASIEAARTTLTVVALVGNVDVYVPEGIDVEVGGVVVLGHRRDWGRDVSVPDAPSLRIHAFGIVGTIDVWRVPRELTGDYGAIVRHVQRAHRAPDMPAGRPPSDWGAV